jgi:integrase/recombinase XerD
MESQLLAFLEYLQQEFKYSNNTTAAYRNDLNQFLTFLQGEQYSGLAAWSAVTPEIIDDYIEHMKSQAYASSSIARKVAAVKSFFNFMHARDVVDRNPTTRIDSPRVEKRLPRILTRHDVDQLLKAPADKKSPKHLRDTALLTTLYATGMRVTEIVSLRLQDIDLDNLRLFCPGKADQVRELPFDKTTGAILARYLKEGRPYLAKATEEEEEAVFLNHRGHQLTRQGLWLIIKAYAKQAKLSAEVTPHTLRHSFAAHNVRNGIDLQEVQRLLGHANISTTQIYSQIERDKQKEG